MNHLFTTISEDELHRQLRDDATTPQAKTKAIIHFCRINYSRINELNSYLHQGIQLALSIQDQPMADAFNIYLAFCRV